MFGNRLCYTQSIGGKRRGLIYQSSDVRKLIVNGNKIYFNYAYGGSSNMYPYIEFAPNGEVDLCISYIGNQYTWNVEAVTLNDNWYPLYMFPCYEFTFDNLYFNVADFPTEITVPQQYKLKKETVTLTGYDGTTTTIEAVILYYDISNVPIVTSGSFSYYNIASLETVPIKFKFDNKRYKYDLNKDFEFITEGDYKYFEYRGDHMDYVNGTLRMVGLNDFKTGHQINKFNIYQYELTPTANPNRYEPSNDNYCYEIEVRSTHGLKLDGTAGSNGYYNGLYFGPSCSITLGLWNYYLQTPHERNERVNNVNYHYVNYPYSSPNLLPSDTLTGSALSPSTLYQWAESMSTGYFDLDLTVTRHPFHYYNSLTFEFENNYSQYGSAGITLNNFDEKYLSDFTP